MIRHYYIYNVSQFGERIVGDPIGVRSYNIPESSPWNMINSAKDEYFRECGNHWFDLREVTIDDLTDAVKRLSKRLNTLEQWREYATYMELGNAVDVESI